MAQSEEVFGLEWQRSLPGLSGIAVVACSDGGFLVLGEDASYNGSSGEYYDAHNVVVKTDSQGNVVWSKTVVYQEGGPRTRLSEVVEADGGGYILGGVAEADQYSLSAHFCAIKINSAGDVVWRVQSPFERAQNSFQVNALAAASDGGCLLIGDFSYAAPSVPSIVLTRVYGNGQIEYSGKIPDGNPIFPFFSGSVVWAKQTSDGGFLLLNNQGQSHPISPSSTSLLKLDPNGNIAWSKSYGGSGGFYHTGGGSVLALDDGYLVAGMAAPESSWSGGMILRTDSAGNMQWNQTYSTLSYINSALNTTDGFLLLSQGVDTPDSKEAQIWLTQTSSQGDIQRQTSILTVNTYMLTGLSQMVPTHDGGAVFTAGFFYERSGEADGSDSAVNRFWIAKVSEGSSGGGLADSGLNVVLVGYAVGVVAASALGVLVTLKVWKRMKNKR